LIQDIDYGVKYAPKYCGAVLGKSFLNVLKRATVVKYLLESDEDTAVQEIRVLRGDIDSIDSAGSL
jgi:hypothetical protein